LKRAAIEIDGNRIARIRTVATARPLKGEVIDAQNIGSEHFGTQPFDGLFSMYMAPNLGRLAVFLQQPQNYSPFSSNDQTGTYGAAWALLRYAADHRGSGDGDVWLRLVNSQVAGLDNLGN